MDRNIAGLCIAYMLDGGLILALVRYRDYRRRDMHKENGDLDDLTETDSTVGSFSFDNRRSRGIMVVRFSHTLLLEFLGHPLHDLPVLSVDHGSEIVFARSQHDI
jgi:hypothetical protein